MSAIKSSKEPIVKIVNELSKLKKQLRSIKSMKTLSLLQPHRMPDSQSSKKTTSNFSKKQKMKSTFDKSRSTLVLNKDADTRQKVQTERKKVSNKIDMSICKEIRRSLSKSDSQSRSKTKGKSKDKKIGQKEQNRKKMKNQAEKVSDFNNLYAHTKSIRKQNNEIDDQNEYLETKPKKSFVQKSFAQKPTLLNQDVSFAHQAKFCNRPDQSPCLNSSNFDAKVNFKELNSRVKTNANYEPQFAGINFAFDFLMAQNFQKSSTNLTRKNSLSSSYSLKSEVLFNKLKKSLLRFPNYTAILQASLQNQLPIQIQRLFNDANEKTLQMVQQRYTQYLQQVQCDINQIVNFFNQYQNEKDILGIKNRNQRLYTDLRRQKDVITEKENLPSLANIEQKNTQNLLKTEYEGLNKQMKQMKKYINKLEKQLKERDQQFLELEFKYILKCQHQQNSLKFGKDNIQYLSSSQFNQENHKIQSHIQILQEENLQLHEKIEILTRQMNHAASLKNQYEEKNSELIKLIQKLSKEISDSQKFKELRDQDFNLIQIQNDNLKQQLQKVTSERKRQKQKYKQKVFEVQTLNEQLKKDLSSRNKELKNFQYQCKKFESQNSNLKQTFTHSQQKYQNQILDLERQKEKYHKNEAIINKKVEQLTKENFTLMQGSDSLSNENEKLRDELKRLSEQMTRYRQKLLVMEKIQKQNDVLKRQNLKLLANVQELQKESAQLSESVLILKAELETEYKRVKQLEDSIQRYKDRCVKAEIQLKQQKYLESKNSTKQKQQENLEQIHKIIQSHKNKLSLGE